MSLASVVPMLPVQNLVASIAFYRQLGFEVENFRDDWAWASITLGTHRIMLDRSIGVGVHASCNAVVYLYAHDLDQFWQRASQAGLKLPEIAETFYGMREFRVLDPSGNQIWVGQFRA